MSAQLRSALGRGPTGRTLPSAGVPLMPGPARGRSSARPLGHQRRPALRQLAGRRRGGQAGRRGPRLGVPAVLTRHGEHRLTRARVDASRRRRGHTRARRRGAPVRSSGRRRLPGRARRHRTPRRVSPSPTRDCGWSCAGSTPAAAPGSGGRWWQGRRWGLWPPEGAEHGLQVQLTHLPTGDTPAFVSPDLGDGWLAVCPDPTALILGREVSNPPRETSDASLLHAGIGRSPPCRSTTTTTRP